MVGVSLLWEGVPLSNDGQRVDRELDGGAVYTKKVMPNGEVRERVKLTSGLFASETRAKKWSFGDEQPWQNAHFHKGRTEVYTLVSGWALFMYRRNGSTTKAKVLRNDGSTICFYPGEEHRVLLGPEAVIFTIVFGEPVGNPKRKNNDWWPASDDFVQSLRGMEFSCVALIRKQFGLPPVVFRC